MNYKEEYAKKLITADEAAAMVKDGDKICFGANITMAYDFDFALAKRVGELKDIKIYSKLNPKTEPFETFKANMALGADSAPERVKFISAHFGPHDRKMRDEGDCWFMPMLFNEFPSYMRDIIKPDIEVIQMTPMDENGNFTFGPSMAGTKAEIEGSKIVIVEVNKNMPVTYGFDSVVNISEVDYVIEGSNPPLPTYPPVVNLDEKDVAIANIIAEMVENESTLQLGIGSLPTAVGKALVKSDIEELYCHTEVIADPYVELYEAGKLKGNKYTDEGKIVYSSVTGTEKVYEFVDRNPLCAIAPIDFVNNVSVIAAIDRFMSINGCLGADLFGQVSSESFGPKHFSGTGGQLDFALGAYASKGGKSFICTHSAKTLKDGSIVSSITPTLQEGTIVTTPRAAVHYFVTEYGAVNLKGKSTYERAEALISVAHPEFREDLIKDAEKMGIWSRTSKLSV
ncbi:MAG: butyryl-CoA:acetate CoA-transferase [Firmicutes bacterium]|nr:butyryl-CoA:acetate CoA-transferase [Bacillota bacterium]